MSNIQGNINEIKVSYKMQKLSSRKITTSQLAESYAREMYCQSGCEIELKEYFFIILLNRANEVIGFHKLSEGGICGTVVDIRLAFATALKSLASGIILVHNHPSGNLSASQPDIELTKKFKKAGELLDITIIDHIILASSCYSSFADQGLVI
ncbi:MAG TPA: JAB domain-containing protein [Bacteroidia bacterium]|nr:JAB domain-containing protein [Bacteroidia bacterium]